MSISSNLKAKLKILPESSGVYVMVDNKNTVIYVGKAKILKNRVKSYFNRKIEDKKVKQLLKNITDLSWIETENEMEALMLETNLIKKYRPKYNILMKDDKNYIYLKVTNDEYPRVLLVRKIFKDGSKYFGPYTDKYEVQELLKMLNRLFPFFTYANQSGVAPMNSRAGKELFYKRAKTVWGDITQVDIYQHMISDFVAFMRGKSQAVEEFFVMEMNKASVEKDFEMAAWIRDRIAQLRKMMVRQIVIIPRPENIDVVNYAEKEGRGFVCILIVRFGKLVDIKYFEIINHADKSVSDVIQKLLLDYYVLTLDFPEKIYCVENLPDHDLVEKFLINRTKRRIKIKYPKRGAGLRLLNLAGRNARSEVNRRTILTDYARNNSVGLRSLLESVVGDKKAEKWWNEIIRDKIFRIEAFDISNLGEKGVVGALVVWEIKPKLLKEKRAEKIENWSGDFNKSCYKRFKIKSFVGQNDFLSLREVFGRRFARRNDGWKWPDLILIDGGKGQLSSAMAVLAEIGVNIPTLSIAKKEEEIWMGTREEDEIDFVKLDIKKESLEGLLLQDIRNEVHRFVIGYQRITRKNSMKKSVLDEIVGLGPKTKKILLTEYGSVKAISLVGRDELENKVGKKIAEKIWQRLNQV
ncbi:MAG: excinuclease ABC subunit UvrC [Patescibacteria group bacterium]